MRRETVDLGVMSAHLESLAIPGKTAAKEHNRRAMLMGTMVAVCGGYGLRVGSEDGAS